MSQSPFIETVRAAIRLRGYSIRTEKSYLYWIRYYICFHKKRHPKDMGPVEVRSFLSWLASSRHVAINTQKVALNALVFLYRHITGRELGDLGFTHATRQRQLPVVLSAAEVLSILQKLAPLYCLIISMLYGSGLRISECLRLRVQDVDLQRLS